MSDSLSCKICATPPIPVVTFVEHLLGKRHGKRAKARKCIDDSINKCSIQINSKEENLEKFAEQVIFKYLEFNVVDAQVFKKKIFIEFKTHENATKALSAKIEINGLKFWTSHVQEDRRRNPGKGGKGVKGHIPQISPELLKQLDTTAHGYDPDYLILRLVKEIELKPRDKLIREEIRAAVESFLDPLFPSGRTYIFGSSANNLGFTGCDVDMVADLGYDCWSGQTRIAAEKDADKLTKYIAKELRRRRLGNQVIAIGRARVPIVKFHDTMYNLEVDLSFKNGMPIYNTQLIEMYSNTHSIVKPFMMFIRYWAKVQSVAGGGQPTFLLTNYCLCMMMLFWLIIRSEPIVPCVKELQHGVEPVFIDGCNCSFQTNVEEWRKKYHNIKLIDLVIEFFEFYGQMNCKEYIISPLEGRLIPRKSLKDLQAKGTKPVNGNTQTLQLNTPLCVQDPFDTSHNISRGFREEALNEFQLKCWKAQKITKDIRERKVAFSSLFAEYDLDEVGQLEDDIKEATVVDEVVSVACSEESVELLQELESLERSGGLQELMENADIDKPSESDSQGSSDSVIICENSVDTTCKDSSYSHSKVISTPVSKVLNKVKGEEIILLGEIAKDSGNSEIELVNLDDSSDFVGKVIEVQAKEDIIKSETSEKEFKNSIIKLSESCNSCNSLSSRQDNEFYTKDTFEFNPIYEEFKFTFEYYSKTLFSIDDVGNILFLKSKSIPHSKSKDECISDLYSFILKRVLLCEILDDSITLPQNIHKKRKISGDDSSPNKLLKLSDCESVSTKSDFTLVSSYKCKTLYKVWEGRKKLIKDATESSANPLQSELFITNKLDKSETKNFNIDFETTLWRENNNFTHYLVTVHQGQSDDTKLESKFNCFYIFFVKFVVNLLHKVDGFNFRS